MRLNREMRREIRQFAMAKLQKQRQSFALVEQGLMVECYNAVVPAATRVLIADLDKHIVNGYAWVRYDEIFQFNVAGQTVSLGQANITDATLRIRLPAPYRIWHTPLGVITLDKHKKLVERVRDWQGKVEQENMDFETAVKTLDCLLKSVSTVEKLKQYWPEGKDFFSSPPCETRAASGVPALQIEALNKMLGIKTEDLVV
jgi:hypothetical protein